MFSRKTSHLLQGVQPLSPSAMGWERPPWPCLWGDRSGGCQFSTCLLPGWRVYPTCTPRDPEVRITSTVLGVTVSPPPLPGTRLSLTSTCPPPQEQPGVMFHRFWRVKTELGMAGKEE